MRPLIYCIGVFLIFMVWLIIAAKREDRRMKKK